MAVILKSCSSVSSKIDIPTFNRKLYEKNQWLPKKRLSVIVRCSSVESVADLFRNGQRIEEERRIKYMTSECGWRVRRLIEDNQDEIRRVTLVQSEAFHIPMFFYNEIFFEFFKAEVLSGLLYKLRNSPPDRYACLVAEAESSLVGSESVVGVVDVTVLRDESVLKHSPDSQEYLYISGLAVSKSFRRRKIGSVLLKACDVLCGVWGYRLLALRAYEDDIGARKVYSNAGYHVVSADPPWFTTWLGRKRRVLMIKQLQS